MVFSHSAQLFTFYRYACHPQQKLWRSVEELLRSNHVLNSKNNSLVSFCWLRCRAGLGL